MDQRQVLLGRRLLEMPIHGRAAGTHGVERIRPHRGRGRQSHRRPQRKPTAGPLAHRQHPVRRNAKFDGATGMRADREAAPSRRIRVQAGILPGQQTLTMRQHLVGRKTLGHKNDHGRVGIEPDQQALPLEGVDGTDEMHAGRPAAGRKRVTYQAGAQQRAADTHVDDVAYRLPRIAR
jgi:hypothetical protein